MSFFCFLRRIVGIHLEILLMMIDRYKKQHYYEKNTIIKLNVYSIVLYFSNRDLSMYWIAKRRVNIIVQTVWTNIIHWKSRIRWSLSHFITKTFITWIVQSLIWMILFSEYFRLITKVRVFINIHWLQCASVLSSDSLRI